MDPVVWGNPGNADHLGLLQVLERWCVSPRTIEVLMNTYSVVRLPEGAMGLVPPEILQVRLQDPDHTIMQPTRDSHLLKGSPVGPPILPHRNYPEILSRPRRKLRMNTPNPPYSQKAPEDTHWPPASPCGRTRCHLSKAAFAEALVLSPEAPLFLLLPLRLGEAAQIAAAPEPLCAQSSPGGPPAPCPAPPSPATPPAPIPAAGI